MVSQDILAKMLGSWSAVPGWPADLFRILLSVVLASIIGMERSVKRHSAGLRTFIIMTLAATVAMLIDTHLSALHKAPCYYISAATVIACAVICVNSMLFSSRSQIKGLTTSTGLFACAAVGLSCGAGLYTVTLAAFAALLSGLYCFPALEKYLKNRSNHFEIHLELTSSAHLQDFVTTIRKLGLIIDDIENNPAYQNSGLSVYSICLTISSDELKKYKTHREIIEALSTLEYVYHVEEMRN